MLLMELRRTRCSEGGGGLCICFSFCCVALLKEHLSHCLSKRTPRLQPRCQLSVHKLWLQFSLLLQPLDERSGETTATWSSDPLRRHCKRLRLSSELRRFLNAGSFSLGSVSFAPDAARIQDESTQHVVLCNTRRLTPRCCVRQSHQRGGGGVGVHSN